MSERPLSELDAELGDLRDSESSSNGVWFDCPVCTPTHSIYVPWQGTSPFTSGAMWQLQSEPRLDVLTLHPSVDCSRGGDCKFHGWVQQGKVRW